MAYTGDWINELDSATPAGSEAKSIGDDALREIKRALKNTFPNFTASDAFTGTAADLQSLVDGNILPRNTVIMWAGLEGDVPAGWDICDGRARTSGGGNTPDLRDKFIIGAKSDLDVDPAHVRTLTQGNTGGTHEFNARQSYGAGAVYQFTTLAHVLTVSELPDISGSIELGFDAASQSDAHNQTATVARGRLSTVNTWDGAAVRTSAFAGNGHTHNFNIVTTGTDANKPAHYALVFLIKD